MSRGPWEVLHHMHLLSKYTNYFIGHHLEMLTLTFALNALIGHQGDVHFDLHFEFSDWSPFRNTDLDLHFEYFDWLAH